MRDGIQVTVTRLLTIDKSKFSMVAKAFMDVELMGLTAADEKFLPMVCQSPSALSLYLRLRKFAGKKSGFSARIVDNKECLRKVAGLLKQTLYTFPAVHSAVLLLCEMVESKADFENVFKTLCVDLAFSENILADMKSASRYKLMNVGFHIISRTLRKDCVEYLLNSEEFIAAFLRNVSSGKVATQETAKDLKASIAAKLEGISPKAAYKLLVNLFGPNSLRHLSIKKNYDIVLPLTKALGADEITEYVLYLQEQFDNPSKKRYEAEPNQIRYFILNVASNLPQLFHESRDKLENRHIMAAAQLVTKAAFTRATNTQMDLKDVQPKFFQLLAHLSKLKGKEGRGFAKEGELWLMRINRLINKLLSAEETEAAEGELDLESLVKIHKTNLKYCEQFADLKKNERTRVQAVALETLYLSLCPFVLLPGQKPQQVSDALEDIDELKSCIAGLDIGKR